MYDDQSSSALAFFRNTLTKPSSVWNTNNVCRLESEKDNNKQIKSGKIVGVCGGGVGGRGGAVQEVQVKSKWVQFFWEWLNITKIHSGSWDKRPPCWLRDHPSINSIKTTFFSPETFPTKHLSWPLWFDFKMILKAGVPLCWSFPIKPKKCKCIVIDN